MKICEFCKMQILSGKTEFFIRNIELIEEKMQVCRDCFQIAGIANKVSRKNKLIERYNRAIKINVNLKIKDGTNMKEFLRYLNNL